MSNNKRETNKCNDMPHKNETFNIMHEINKSIILYIRNYTTSVSHESMTYMIIQNKSLL